MKKGQIVVKILDGAGFRTASFHRIRAVKKGIAFLGDGRAADDVSAYDAKEGYALNNYVPGFTTYIVELDDGEEDNVTLKESGE